ncbi:putative WEB family protein [Camellia lanceoleosa]|uniref:WEB family protein n=1 Tax=Camellia lanceoleosa TaxID=1840588 RepID=A0ACC0J4F5_9ERIC|nr:putative WEB family protein [Camellia lanceoleosa]
MGIVPKEVEKQPTRVLKGSELKAQLSLVQEDLKKAQEKLVLVEKEKAQANEELKETQRLAEEANDKLREALATQKRVEENSEIEKFRPVEMEQAGIEASQKKEEEWQKEVEAVRNQHERLADRVKELLVAADVYQRG